MCNTGAEFEEGEPIEQNMFERIQYVGKIIGNNNLIINGDVIDNGKILSTVATHVMRQDLEQVSQEAREEMKACVNECTQKVAVEVVAFAGIVTNGFPFLLREGRAICSLKNDYTL